MTLAARRLRIRRHNALVRFVPLAMAFVGLALILAVFLTGEIR